MPMCGPWGLPGSQRPGHRTAPPAPDVVAGLEGGARPFFRVEAADAGGLRPASPTAPARERARTHGRAVSPIPSARGSVRDDGNDGSGPCRRARARPLPAQARRGDLPGADRGPHAPAAPRGAGVRRGRGSSRADADARGDRRRARAKARRQARRGGRAGPVRRARARVAHRRRAPGAHHAAPHRRGAREPRRLPGDRCRRSCWVPRRAPRPRRVRPSWRNPRALNAEDDRTLHATRGGHRPGPARSEIEVGVLRGGGARAPPLRRPADLRAGINLTRPLPRKIPLPLLLVRDLGLVNKIYRGLSTAEHHPDEPEDTSRSCGSRRWTPTRSAAAASCCTWSIM